MKFLSTFKSDLKFIPWLKEIPDSNNAFICHHINDKLSSKYYKYTFNDTQAFRVQEYKTESIAILFVIYRISRRNYWLLNLIKLQTSVRQEIVEMVSFQNWKSYELVSLATLTTLSAKIDAKFFILFAITKFPNWIHRGFSRL